MIPAISPGAIDWELELAVIIGRRCKGVSEADALQYVAGYTIVNDISNRKFRPNPVVADARKTISLTGCTASGTTASVRAGRVSRRPTRSPTRKISRCNCG